MWCHLTFWFVRAQPAPPAGLLPRAFHSAAAFDDSPHLAATQPSYTQAILIAGGVDTATQLPTALSSVYKLHWDVSTAQFRWTSPGDATAPAALPTPRFGAQLVVDEGGSVWLTSGLRVWPGNGTLESGVVAASDVVPGAYPVVRGQYGAYRMLQYNRTSGAWQYVGGQPPVGLGSAMHAAWAHGGCVYMYGGFRDTFSGPDAAAGWAPLSLFCAAGGGGGGTWYAGDGDTMGWGGTSGLGNGRGALPGNATGPLVGVRFVTCLCTVDAKFVLP